MATVILLEAAPTAFQNIGYKFWIILICLTVVYAVLVYLYLPEVGLPLTYIFVDIADRFEQTRGMTLEDISVLFGDPVELSFEQALNQEHDGKGGSEEKGVISAAHEHVESKSP